MTIRTRLVATVLLLVTVIGGGALWLLEDRLASDLVGSLDARLRSQGAGVAAWLRKAGHPDRLAPRLASVVGARVTIVGADGIVIADSSGGAGAQIGDAPEIRAVHAGAVGRARRALEPGAPISYLVAVPGDDGRVIRLAVPMRDLAQTRGDLRTQVLGVSALALAVALLLGLLAARAVTRPLAVMTGTAERLARGDYAVPRSAPAPGEIGVLSRALDQLAGEVQRQIGELTAQRDLLSAVVGELVEGVVVVDRGATIAMRTEAARGLIGDAGATALPAPLPAMIAAAQRGLAGDDELVLRGRAVRASVRPLPATGGALVVLYDVTRLRALEAVRGDFLANAAHELRTPVTAIAGYAETLLAGGVDDETGRGFLAIIGRNANRIGRLVADLLTLEQLAARPAAIAARKPIVLAELVADVVATARAAIAVEVGDLAVLGDRDGLEQAVQNLVDNGLQHGGGAVSIRAARDGDRVRLEIADHGPGIAAEHHARLFERFYRVDAGTGDRRGSGLGLAIARQHALAMGGSLELASTPGQGARFTIVLDASPARPGAQGDRKPSS